MTKKRKIQNEIVLDFDIEILNLFRISDLGFRIWNSVGNNWNR